MNFNVNQKVYDGVNAPGKEGTVLKTDSESYHGGQYPVEVKFEGSKYIGFYTSDGRLYDESKPTLSATPYEFVIPS